MSHHVARIIYLFEERHAAITAPSHLLKRIKCAQAHVVEPSLNLYVAAASSDGRTVRPQPLIARTKSVAQQDADLIESFDFVLRLHNGLVTHRLAPRLLRTAAACNWYGPSQARTGLDSRDHATSVLHGRPEARQMCHRHLAPNSSGNSFIRRSTGRS